MKWNRGISSCFYWRGGKIQNEAVRFGDFNFSLSTFLSNPCLLCPNLIADCHMKWGIAPNILHHKEIQTNQDSYKWCKRVWILLLWMWSFSLRSSEGHAFSVHARFLKAGLRRHINEQRAFTRSESHLCPASRHIGLGQKIDCVRCMWPATRLRWFWKYKMLYSNEMLHFYCWI